MNNIHKFIILLLLVIKPHVLGSQKEVKVKQETQSTQMCPTVKGKYQSSPMIRALAFKCLTLCGEKNPHTVTITNDQKGDRAGLTKINGKKRLRINFDEQYNKDYPYGVSHSGLLHECYHIAKRQIGLDSGKKKSINYFLQSHNYERDADDALALGSCEQCVKETANYYYKQANIKQHATLAEFIQANTKKQSLNSLILQKKQSLSDRGAFARKTLHPADIERALRMHKLLSHKNVAGKLCTYHAQEKLKTEQANSWQTYDCRTQTYCPSTDYKKRKDVTDIATYASKKARIDQENQDTVKAQNQWRSYDCSTQTYYTATPNCK